MMELGSNVRVSVGRRAGQAGVVKRLNTADPNELEFVYVDFGGVVVAEGDMYPDAYWVNVENVEEK